MSTEEALRLVDGTYCPSAQPSIPGSQVIGVVSGTADAPRTSFFDEFLIPTDEILSLADPVDPTEVFRFAAPCQGTRCSHFDGHRCRLVKQIVEILPAVSPDVMPCNLRPSCRWFMQEGNDACKRCPQIVTELYAPTLEQRRATKPWRIAELGEKKK
jgi:hypothetical protein